MNRSAELVLSTGKRVKRSDRFGAATLNRALFMIAIAAFLLTAASFFGRASWLLELLTHFRPHLALGALVLLLCALARRRLATAMLVGIAAAANVSPLIPYILPGAIAVEAGDNQVRIMAANVSYRNSDFAALREIIRKETPDVVGLLEVDQAWVDAMAPIASEYPYTVLRPEDGAYGLALFSRLPVRELETSPYIEKGLQTAIAVELELEQVAITLMLTHVRAPTSPGKARLRNIQLTRIAGMLAADGNEEQILIGDLNTTPWSPYYLELEAETKMVNAALGRGYQPTWPSGFSMLKIPIDHCLVSDGLRVQQFRTGLDFGSDHLPIVVDLAIAEIDTAGLSAERQSPQT